MESKELKETLAFDSLYDENFAFVWRTIRAMGVPPSLLDDAVQEVFMVVHRRLDSYNPEASIRSWLFGISRRVAKDFRRSLQRKGMTVPIKEELLSSEKQSPDALAGANEELRFIESFANTLDEERRAIFVLSMIEQMPVTEVAQVLGLNLNTVYSRLKIIRKNLSNMVSKLYGDTDGE